MKKRILIVVCVCIFLCVLHFSVRRPQLTGVATVQTIDAQNTITISIDRKYIYNPLLREGIDQFYRVYKIHNHSNEVIYISHSSWIERSVDGVWYTLAVPQSNAMASISAEPTWRIEPNYVYEYPADHISAWRNQLRPGRHRIVFTAHLESSDTPFYIAVEFTIL